MSSLIARVEVLEEAANETPNDIAVMISNARSVPPVRVPLATLEKSRAPLAQRIAQARRRVFGQ